MSDTPRTDAACLSFARLMVETGTPDNPSCKTTQILPADFARDLERENAALRRDAERYRWLRDNRLANNVNFPLAMGWRPEEWDACRIDAAIDAAREAK